MTWIADNGDGTFSNPLFFDEFSDPDLIRVDRDFYLTGTTMHAMPGLPVLHSRDLVNWEFLSYAADRLDFGPEFRLEGGGQIYGQGIWAPSFRYHRGTFHIFTNVRGQPMQIYRATNPRGPWTRTAMKRGFHDPSVLFDDDGKIYVVWGYRDLRLAQLDTNLTDIIPGTERILFRPDQGMGEGAHFYKIRGKYYITSAWYLGVMKMPCARADRPEGPYEVKDISGGEDFGVANGAMHQGGIVETPAGEWWGFSMMDYNALGRLTGLSPVTWKDGWPYFGLPGNPGRSPRTWVKPKTGATSRPSAPFVRSDDFSGRTLSPLWQWNHAPDDTKWSLSERRGFLRLHSLPAADFWLARNSLTQRAVGPISTATVEMETDDLQNADIAGLGLLNAPYAWIGVRRDASARWIEQFDQSTGKTARVPFAGSRLWLRADCDFFTERAQLSYRTDSAQFRPLGEPFRMVFQLKTFQGVRYSLFHYNAAGSPGGSADFARFTVDEPHSRGRMTPIPGNREIVLSGTDSGQVLAVRDSKLVAVSPSDPLASGSAAHFRVVELGSGRVALQSISGLVSVAGAADREITLKPGRAGLLESFQWIETISGELTLLSLSTERYLRIVDEAGSVTADSRGPTKRSSDGARFHWK